MGLFSNSNFEHSKKSILNDVQYINIEIEKLLKYIDSCGGVNHSNSQPIVNKLNQLYQKQTEAVNLFETFTQSQAASLYVPWINGETMNFAHWNMMYGMVFMDIANDLEKIGVQ